MKQQQQNHHIRIDSSLSHWLGEAKMHFTGIKSFPYVLLLLKHKKMISSYGGFLTNAMYHHRKLI